jgi:hypothetical protein
VIEVELGSRLRPRYGGAVDVDRAADLYSEGRTLRQIGAELGIPWAAVGDQLRRAGVTMRRGARPHPASTQQILELRDQGLTWNEVARQVDMTVSGAWSRYRKARPLKPPRLGRWQQVLADALDQNLAIGVRAAVADHLGRAPAELSSPPPDEPPTVSPLSVVPVCFIGRAPMLTTIQVTAAIWCSPNPT